jgi:AraC-like DNA-binding protein
VAAVMQDASPSIALAYLRGLFDFLRRRELSSAPVLEALGISEADLRDPDLRIAHNLQHAAFEAAEQVSGDAHVGLHAGQFTHLIHFGMLGQMAMCCKTPRELMELHGRYQRLISTGADMTYVERDGALIGEANFEDPTGDSRHQVEYTLASHTSLFRLMAGGLPVSCSRIDVTYAPPDDPSEAQRILGCPIRYDCDVMRIYVSALLLDLPLIGAAPAVRLQLEIEARRRLDALRAPPPHADPELERLKQFVLDQLGKGNGAPSIQVAADLLATSERTLQRRLEAHGLSYRDLIDDVRRTLVAALLADPQLAQAEIALMLGFSDQSAFHRAFRRWYGMTPGEYRTRSERT